MEILMVVLAVLGCAVGVFGIGYAIGKDIGEIKNNRR